MIGNRIRKGLLLLGIILLANLSMSAQEKWLADILSDEPFHIIYSKPLDVDDYLEEVYLNVLLSPQSLDTITREVVIDVLKQWQIQQDTVYDSWKPLEMERLGLLFHRPQSIDMETAIEVHPQLDSLQLVELKKQLIQHNSGNEWTSIPLQISRPILSSSLQHALVVVKYGNERSACYLYRREGDSWLRKTTVTSWMN